MATQVVGAHGSHLRGLLESCPFTGWYFSYSVNTDRFDKRETYITSTHGLSLVKVCKSGHVIPPVMKRLTLVFTTVGDRLADELVFLGSLKVSFLSRQYTNRTQAERILHHKHIPSHACCNLTINTVPERMVRSYLRW